MVPAILNFRSERYSKIWMEDTHTHTHTHTHTKSGEQTEAGRRLVPEYHAHGHTLDAYKRTHTAPSTGAPLTTLPTPDQAQKWYPEGCCGRTAIG